MKLDVTTVFRHEPVCRHRGWHETHHSSSPQPSEGYVGHGEATSIPLPTLLAVIYCWLLVSLTTN